MRVFFQIFSSSPFSFVLRTRPMLCWLKSIKFLTSRYNLISTWVIVAPSITKVARRRTTHTTSLYSPAVWVCHVASQHPLTSNTTVKEMLGLPQFWHVISSDGIFNGTTTTPIIIKIYSPHKFLVHMDSQNTNSADQSRPIPVINQLPKKFPPPFFWKSKTPLVPVRTIPDHSLCTILFSRIYII